MTNHRLGLRRAVCAGVSLAIAGLSLAAWTSGSALGSVRATGASQATAAKVHGGTIIWAEPPATTPNWILPFASDPYFGNINFLDFWPLMFRPLYFFGGETNQPTVDEPLSIAKLPVFSAGGTTVTINLKGWKWSNGQTVDAQDVIFFMNMLEAEKANFAGYVPGEFPDNVVSYSAPSATSLTVTMKLKRGFSSTWFLYNELSQVTPMPLMWDTTSLTGAPGSGGCSAMTGPQATAAACVKVWTFLTDNNGTSATPQMAGDLATYATNPMWQDVDGPWRLTAFDASSGEATFVPNTHYSGPQKPYVSTFIEMPYTSDTAEFNALAAGGPSAPQVGYVPTQDLTTPTSNYKKTGPNNSLLASNYTLDPLYAWGISFDRANYNSTGDGGLAGKFIHQLYIRQALQMGVDQPQIIAKVDKGYAVPTYGPVPVYPSNPFISKGELVNQYPYNVAKGAALLKSHGWKVVAGGTDTCVKAGTAADECGSGIPAGTKLQFTMLSVSGDQAVTTTVQSEVSSWSQMGINVTTKSETFETVLGQMVPCKSGPVCSWELADWGGGWTYSPDYEATGDLIFSTGAGFNKMSYSDPTADALIAKTETSSNPANFAAYENYLAKQLPVIWEPFAASQMVEIGKNVGGVEPLNPVLSLTPEYWYLTKG
jgi:peptide/nickel transport system substrate-binding protein